MSNSPNPVREETHGLASPPRQLNDSDAFLPTSLIFVVSVLIDQCVINYPKLTVTHIAPSDKQPDRVDSSVVEGKKSANLSSKSLLSRNEKYGLLCDR